MKVLKRELPEGVKKQFIVKLGKKVKVINTRYLKGIQKNGKKASN